MSSDNYVKGLVECVAPLDADGRRAVRRYWERVIREEWVPPNRRAPRPVPLAEDGRRERREARRAVARIASASRVEVGRRAGLAGQEQELTSATGEAA